MLFQVFSVFLFCVIFAAVVAFVFLPVIIAHKRKHRNKWVIAVLVVFSLFIVGVPGVILWVVALAWSLYKESDKAAQGIPVPKGPPGPMGVRGENGVLSMEEAAKLMASGEFADGNPPGPTISKRNKRGVVTVPLSKSGRRK